MPKQPQRGGARKGAGRKSAFPGMVSKPFPMDFTPEGRARLEKITERTGLSRNNVLTFLALTFAHKLTFSALEPGTVYPGKAQQVLAIRVSAKAAAKLTAARDRTGKSYSDIGEALVRRYGRSASFPAPPSSEAQTAPRRSPRRRRT